MRVQFKNPKTGEIMEVKVGWSWTLFLFSGVWGLPLFVRRLNLWGALMAGLGVISLFVSNLAVLLILFFVSIGFAIFFGIKGNEMTAKNCLEKGWEILNPDSDVVKLAMTTWKIAV